jgi:predicted membrane-bound spermidine synthase
MSFATTESTAPEPRVRTLCVLFFFSGFPALVYQLVWQRALFRMFGVNVESVTVVVTAFMVGLGLGSLLGGALSRWRVPLLPLLAVIELATAAFGLASPAIFDAAAERLLGTSLAVTAAASLALVILPTLLMGATLPLLVGHLVRRTAEVGGSVGLLYHVNTLGAGAACLVSAAVLFPFLGMRGSLAVAAAMNAAVAIGAVAAHLRRGGGNGRAAQAPAPAAARDVPTPFAPALALAALGGMVSLSWEILFFRTISYATGSSASAFALTLFAFLCGLASGARAAGRSCRGRETALAGARRALLVGSAVGFAFLPASGRLAGLGLAALAPMLALVFLVARSFGVLLPTVAHLAVEADARAGMRTAQLYLANIAGSAAGSVATGFVLLDRLPLAAACAAVVLAGVACAALLDALSPPPRRAWAPRAAALLAAGAVAAAALPALAADVLERLLRRRGEAAPLTHLVENRSGIIAVDASGTVYGHGMYDGRFNTDLVTDTNGIFRAYALGLFHPAPRDVLVIGLSSGSWVQVIANHPEARTVTVVEINAGAVGIVSRHPAVASLLANPKVRIEVDDGRRWLVRNRDRRFDAIVSNTTYYFRASASNLLSAEFLALVRDRLRPGGIFLYNTTGSERAQRTGCLAFPHGVRFSNQLVVSGSPLAADFARWRAALSAWRIDGRPALDPSRPEARRTLDALMSLGGELAPRHARTLEPCGEILARTAGRPPITDDNMGSEWRFVYGLE